MALSGRLRGTLAAPPAPPQSASGEVAFNAIQHGRPFDPDMFACNVWQPGREDEDVQKLVAGIQP